MRNLLSCVALFSLCLLASSPAGAQCGSCPSGGPVAAFLCPDTPQVAGPSNCAGFPGCAQPRLEGPFFDLLPEPDGETTVRLRVEVTAPNNHLNDNSAFWPFVFWYDGATAPDTPSLDVCTFGRYDRAATYVEAQNVTCDGGDFGTYSVRVKTCGFLFCSPPARLEGMRFVVPPGSLPGCNLRRWVCDDCRNCKSAGDGSASPAGKGAVAAPGGSGPGARLRYAAGGVGGPSLPGSAAWRQALGAYWSHDYALRLVPDPDDSRVWLLTETAVYHEFRDLAGGVYQTASPSDEHRMLTRTPTGWELRELDGRVHAFDATGAWTGTTDRHGNAKLAIYSAGQLIRVTFPDGRYETFTYHADGKLAEITEVGVAGEASRTWSYTWSGDALIRIDRPDGSAWEMAYGDARHPGYLTRLELVGNDGSRRVETAWEYDVQGNVTRMWKGATSFTAPEAVEEWAFSYDDPNQPRVTLVTDPLGQVATYSFERDSRSDKPKVISISGDCPSCGLGPNSQISYDDPAHPLKPTREVDGRGISTLMTYDAFGKMTSRTEAAGTPEERTTSWQYHPTFPDLVTRIERPSTAGGAAPAVTTIGYDAQGNAITRTESGAEAGSFFSETTVTTFNTQGRPLTLDPPGYGTDDVTSYTYDPARGNLLPASRTDPLLGTTFFRYDPFQRVIQAEDPNRLVTETAYDALGRVTGVRQFLAQVIERGSAPERSTTYDYTPLGDLLRTTLPEGNILEYGYDSAGRLISQERKGDTETPGERILYTLDAAGNRIREERQRRAGRDWRTAFFESYAYGSRCHLDRTIHADGSVTANAYDCNGNLEHVWDANHPRAAHPPTQSFAYDPLDRLTAVTQPWAGGGLAQTRYRYDVQDHLTEVTDAEDDVTSYTWSDRDLLTQLVSGVTGTTTWAYNEHREQVLQTDARGITVSRTVDALDRVTRLDYPGTDLDTDYLYDNSNVAFSRGRLTAITRNGQAINYAYDLFGRTVRDGALELTFDRNDNPLTITYPESVTVHYTYDFADRPQTAALELPGEASRQLVKEASYLPFGPLDSLTYGNGDGEIRLYDERYRPVSITVPGYLDLRYKTDAVGNILAISDALNPTWAATYGYQAPQYFLTRGDGRWGMRRWSYDKIGNRLSETTEAGTDQYSYPLNAAGGHNPKLTGLLPATGAPQSFLYDPAGNQTRLPGEPSPLSATYSAAGELATLFRGIDDPQTQLTYDGRGFLTRAARLAASGAEAEITEPTYSSEGLLHHLRKEPPGTASRLPEHRFVLYFSGRPLAILTAEQDAAGLVSPDLLYLTTDHLGTPALATDETGWFTLWRGGFEPFGKDWNGAQGAGVFLRFPGQWEDEAWEGEPGGGLLYNVNRWYGSRVGRYTSPDPVSLGALENIDHGSDLPLVPFEAYYLAMLRTAHPQLEHAFGYAAQNPVALGDPLGLFGPGALAAAGGTCVAIDGPAPFGDVIGLPLLVGAGIWAVGKSITDWWGNPDDCDNCGEKARGTCERLRDLCLLNPRQPPANREIFGARKDCGACYRRCKHQAGIWPFDQCPLP